MAGAIAAAGGSVVKVPLAVCIRSVQAGVYPNAMNAASSIVAAAGDSLTASISARCGMTIQICSQVQQHEAIRKQWCSNAESTAT